MVYVIIYIIYIYIYIFPNCTYMQRLRVYPGSACTNTFNNEISVRILYESQERRGMEGE